MAGLGVQEPDMREFLLTKFVCSQCGSNLRLTYAVPKAAGQYAEGEPTGADMVHQLVAIEPCVKCTPPVSKIKAALTHLLESI